MLKTTWIFSIVESETLGEYGFESYQKEPSPSSARIPEVGIERGEVSYDTDCSPPEIIFSLEQDDRMVFPRSWSFPRGTLHPD